MSHLQYRKDKNGQFQAHINKKQYLRDIKGRLEDEVAPYLRLGKEIAGRRQIGFWAMVRLLMPVVEAVGKVVYPDARGSWEAGSRVLNDLGVPYPRIAWKLFRDCLLHSDELVSVIHDESEQYAGWEINFNGGHTKEPLKPRIDVERIFENLFEYLDRHISLANDIDEVCLGAVRISERRQQNDLTLRREVQELFGLPISAP